MRQNAEKQRAIKSKSKKATLRGKSKRRRGTRCDLCYDTQESEWSLSNNFFLIELSPLLQDQGDKPKQELDDDDVVNLMMDR